MHLRYREAPPSPELASLVNSYWEFAVSDGVPGPILHEIFPDGCVSLSFCRMFGHVWRVVGPRIESLRVPVWSGQVFWGIRFAPAAGGVVLGIDPGSIFNEVRDLTEFAPALARHLSESLESRESFEQAAAAFESVLGPLRANEGRIDPIAAAAAANIVENRGAVSIASVAAATGLSLRQFERRFRAAAGLTAKQFARVRRVRETAKELVLGAASDRANLATEFGFADQAHMTRELRATTGAAPTRFEEKARAIDYGPLIS